MTFCRKQRWLRSLWAPLYQRAGGDLFWVKTLVYNVALPTKIQTAFDHFTNGDWEEHISQVNFFILKSRVPIALLSNVKWIVQVNQVKVKVAQMCLTLCNPMAYTVHGILQAGIVEWVAFPSSRGSSQPRDRTQVSCIAGGFFPSWATRNLPKNAQ